MVDARWRIDSLLGWGSTSAVYEATHRNGHRAALKILHQSLCADPVMTERFLREAGIANAIKHRAIVPIRDDGMTEEGCAYLVLDLFAGETLESRRERGGGRIALEELVDVAEELMSAIAAVHAAGVVHRDLKPQNVFITDGGALKLLDFGTARIFDSSAGSAISVQGLVTGTPAFMSPEQARGARAEVDAQSDVWSLGAMLFTLLSGEYVHAGRDAHALLLAAASKPARSLASVAPSIDDRVATVVDRALSHHKEERWPDVQAMRIAFRTAVVTAMPTLRDLRAASDADADDGAPPMSSLHTPLESVRPLPAPPPAPALAPALAPGAAPAPVSALASAPAPVEVPPAPHSESEAPAVTSTQGVARVSAGVPVPALVLGLGAMAAAVLLIVFFKTNGDEPSLSTMATTTVAETTEAPTPEMPKPSATPAPSFIVITAPDEPPKPNNASAAVPTPVPATVNASADEVQASTPEVQASTPRSDAVIALEDAGAVAPVAPVAPLTPVAPVAPATPAPESVAATREAPGSDDPAAEQPAPRSNAVPSATDVELP